MSSKTAPRDVPYHDYLIESLRDPAEAAAYLEAAMDEKDPATFLLALNQVRMADSHASPSGRGRRVAPGEGDPS